MKKRIDNGQPHCNITAPAMLQSASPSPQQLRSRGASRLTKVVKRPWPMPEVLGRSVSLSPATRLYVEGDTIRSVFVISRGVVRLEQSHPSTGRLIARFLGVSSALGVADALLGGSYSWSAVALTDCQVEPLVVEHFHRLRQTERTVAAWVEHTLAREVRKFSDRVSHLGLRDAEERLAWTVTQLLLDFGWRQPDGSIRLAFPIQLRQLADAAMMCPDHAGRILARCANDGAAILKRDGTLLVPAGSHFAHRVLRRR